MLIPDLQGTQKFPGLPRLRGLRQCALLRVDCWCIGRFSHLGAQPELRVSEEWHCDGVFGDQV
ncbi:MAG: hypothetical protein ACKPJJ_12205 [Planctomycetaceae bacterium]